MQSTDNAQPAFQGSTVISTRRDSAIEGVVMRRRKLADGSRVTTAEVSEAMLELLLKTPGGLVRRNTALNPDMIAKAVALHAAGKPRKEAETELGVGAGTYRRLLAEGGVNGRKYTAILTTDNVERAVRVAARFDLTKRNDTINAAKQMGVNSRTLRRLLQKAITTMSLEQIALMRQQEQQVMAAEKLAADEAAGQLSLVATNVADPVVAPGIEPAVNAVEPAPVDDPGFAPVDAGLNGDTRVADPVIAIEPISADTLVVVTNGQVQVADVAPDTVVDAIVALQDPPMPDLSDLSAFIDTPAQ
jgi:predicted DNA-binding protein (UPF0251 family)